MSQEQDEKRRPPSAEDLIERALLADALAMRASEGCHDATAVALSLEGTILAAAAGIVAALDRLTREVSGLIEAVRDAGGVQ